jgi:hypothetical protein
VKVENVPQDASFYDGHVRACYAVDEQGRYVLAKSRGWQVETIATAEAMADLEERVESIRLDVLGGRLSPLAYHMAVRQLTPRLLAPSVRIFRWRIKRHTRPNVFGRLPERVLRRYAECLDVSLEEIRRVPDRRAPLR